MRTLFIALIVVAVMSACCPTPATTPDGKLIPDLRYAEQAFVTYGGYSYLSNRDLVALVIWGSRAKMPGEDSDDQIEYSYNQADKFLKHVAIKHGNKGASEL